MVEGTYVQEARQKLSDSKGIEDTSNESAQNPLQWKSSKGLDLNDDLLDDDLDFGDDLSDHFDGGLIGLEAT